MSEIVKNSIFKQEIFARRYDLVERKIFASTDEILFHRYSDAVILVIEIPGEKLREEEIFKCTLEMPLLDVGEKFYIEEQSKLVEIKSRYRTSKENVVYYIEPITIKDIQTEISKQEAQFKLDRIKEKDQKIEELNKELKEKKNIIEQYRNSFFGRFTKVKIS